MLPLLVLSAVLITNGVYGDTNYRLNTPLRPSSYAIAITPYFNTSEDTAFTFDGEVIINFSTEASTNQIKLHTENLTFTAENITVASASSTLNLNATTPLEFDEKYTFAYINLQSNLVVGTEYSLKITYRGPIRTDLNGFYRNYYMENDVKKWLGATQMEPTHARKVFPCFDEPELKAIFTLTIDRPENYQPSLTNTKLQSTIPLSNGYVREIFHPTPRMSTYLVAFLVSEFEAAGYTTNGTKEFGVFTRPEAKNQSQYAFDFGKRVVGALGDYFGVDYYSTHSHLKLDHIALPDFRAGAMENWGLITYREALFLYVPEESTPYYKYRVAQILAHETTHMWFGNLVTCHWWSNTWLNEGFANYFQDYITALIEPEVGSADILVTGSVYSAYDADESPNSPPISNDNVNSPAEISAHFGTVTYQKAGSVIRMIHHLLGDDSFRIGLNLYLRYYQFESGYPERLYNALNEAVTQTNALQLYPGVNFTDIMNSWISQAGHPILQVDIDYEEKLITLTQRRFYIDSAHSSDELYKIPITYTTQTSPDFVNTKPVYIMDNKTHSLNITNLISENHTWIIFNVQESGLYRVNYDDNSWKIISAALKSNQREQIHKLNRAKIVNDLFAFFYADVVHFNRLYDVLEFLTEETDYSVWYAATRGLNKLRSSFYGTPVLSHIDEYATRLLQSILSKMGYSEQPNEDVPALRNRMQVLELACKVGHTGCIENMVALFRNFKDNGVEVAPSLRPVVYCQGLRYGDGEDYEFMWTRMKTTNIANEASVIGVALGCSTHTDKLKKYLVSMLEENSPIRTQDLTVPLTSILANYSNVHFILHELQDNYELWTTIYSSMDTILSTIASVLRTEHDFEEFESWLSSCTQCSAHDVSSARVSVEAARIQTSWAQAHDDDVLVTLRSSGLLLLPSWFILAFGLLSAFVKL